MNSRTKRTKKRIVLGVGHPWFSCHPQGSSEYDTVYLTKQPVAQSILLRGGEEIVKFKIKNIGNWNKCRLVLEVIS